MPDDHEHILCVVRVLFSVLCVCCVQYIFMYGEGWAGLNFYNSRGYEFIYHTSKYLALSLLTKRTELTIIFWADFWYDE